MKKVFKSIQVLITLIAFTLNSTAVTLLANVADNCATERSAYDTAKNAADNARKALDAAEHAVGEAADKASFAAMIATGGTWAAIWTSRAPGGTKIVGVACATLMLAGSWGNLALAIHQMNDAKSVRTAAIGSYKSANMAANSAWVDLQSCLTQLEQDKKKQKC